MKAVEELRLEPYDDQTGNAITSWVVGATIGYGHLILNNQWDNFKDGINSLQADRLFELDIAPYIETVNSAITASMNQYQLDAAVILCYNIGRGAFRSSSVVKLINNPNAVTSYSSLENAWKAWNKSQGVINQGLVNRRNSEWNIYSQGIYERW
ncbi:lysozyme [Photobacterium galatheae]|uniref:lysozyme n=1 Tax=Photobacterium galatheae TaxID=1654360 RepID=UPI00068F42B7|nr:lysozyme [Photobacterium galatheae]MCM0150765.1 lysozyme [Photobacterium galatheae]